MKEKMVSNEALCTYCGSLSMLLGAGVQTEEAVRTLCEEAGSDEISAAAKQVQQGLAQSGSLAAAVETATAFPPYLRRMVAVGEGSGRTEQVLARLADYYEGQAAMDKRLRSALLYPTALLMVMSLILLFLLCSVLPVFTGVYENLAGGITAGSYRYMTLAYTLGWVAFGVTLAVGAGVPAAWLLWKSGRCRAGFTRFLARWHLTSGAAAQSAMAQFTTAFSTYVASGVDTDTAAAKAQAVVNNEAVQRQLDALLAQMAQGKSFVQAAQALRLYAPLQLRMLASGAAAGRLEQTLAELARSEWAGAEDKVKALTNSVEPALAALLTVSVGLLLVAVMLPLVGIMGSIG